MQGGHRRPPIHSSLLTPHNFRPKTFLHTQMQWLHPFWESPLLSRMRWLLVCLLLLSLFPQPLLAASLKEWTPKRGCHLVGHKRVIEPAGCEAVEVLLNACRGQCLSWSVPSPKRILEGNPSQKITSYSYCCRMSDHEEVQVVVQCTDGPRTLKIPSATQCECFDCNHIGT